MQMIAQLSALAPLLQSRTLYRQQSEGVLIGARSPRQRDTTSSGASLNAGTRLEEPGRRLVVPSCPDLQVPRARHYCRSRGVVEME